MDNKNVQQVKQASWSRTLAPRLTEALNYSRVVALVGARQTGKSTLAKSAGKRSYYSLDDLETFDDAMLDPVNFISRLSGPVTIDEVQRVPRLLLPIKVAVDNDPTFGRFLLTGSA